MKSLRCSIARPASGYGMMCQTWGWPSQTSTSALTPASLARFGAQEWSRRGFLAALRAALEAPTRPGPWRFDDVNEFDADAPGWLDARLTVVLLLLAGPGYGCNTGTVDLEAVPYAFVIVEGSVSWTEDPDRLLALATRIGGRYMGPDRAEEYGARNGGKDELVWAVTEDDRFAIDKTLAVLEDELDPESFFRSHRGFIVRFDRIRAIEPTGAGTFQLLLDHPDEPKVPLARERAKKLRERIPFSG